MGNSNFNENTRVQVPAALHLCKLGYIYLDNICAYDTKTNILIDVFLNAVKRLNPNMSSSDASMPVSYTHLDVYKRQMMMVRSICIGAPGASTRASVAEQVS